MGKVAHGDHLCGGRGVRRGPLCRDSHLAWLPGLWRTSAPPGHRRAFNPLAILPGPDLSRGAASLRGTDPWSRRGVLNPHPSRYYRLGGSLWGCSTLNYGDVGRRSASLSYVPLLRQRWDLNPRPPPLTGAGGRARTYDIGLIRPLLYPRMLLSYSRVRPPHPRSPPDTGAGEGPSRRPLFLVDPVGS